MFQTVIAQPYLLLYFQTKSIKKCLNDFKWQKKRCEVTSLTFHVYTQPCAGSKTFCFFDLVFLFRETLGPYFLSTHKMKKNNLCNKEKKSNFFVMLENSALELNSRTSGFPRKICWPPLWNKKARRRLRRLKTYKSRSPRILLTASFFSSAGTALAKATFHFITRRVPKTLNKRCLPNVSSARSPSCNVQRGQFKGDPEGTRRVVVIRVPDLQVSHFCHVTFFKYA